MQCPNGYTMSAHGVCQPTGNYNRGGLTPRLNPRRGGEIDYESVFADVNPGDISQINEIQQWVAVIVVHVIGIVRVVLEWGVVQVETGQTMDTVVVLIKVVLVVIFGDYVVVEVVQVVGVATLAEVTIGVVISEQEQTQKVVVKELVEEWADQ